MRKLLATLLALVMVFGFVAACGGGDSPAPAPAPAPAPEAPAPAPEAPAPAPAPEPIPVEEIAALRIALVSHSPESILDDGSFNQGAWTGIHNFIAQHGISSDNVSFFQPNEGTTDARVDLIESVIEDWGADILVLPGFHFANSLYLAQDYFPDTKFIFLDSVPSPEGGGDSRIEPNLVSILYAEHESGFFAGYAAVMDGYRDLGFIGGVAVPPVVRFGHGFIQGAEVAAEELGLGAGDVTIRFHYAGQFAPDPAFTTLAGSWYADGTEVIFVAAGGVLFSIIPAAEATADGMIIGVDVDQSGLSDRIITSAKKELAISVADMLNDALNGVFVGGRVITYDTSLNGVGLPWENSKFNNFTKAQYDALFAAVAGGSIKVSDSLDFDEIVGKLTLVKVIEQ